MRSTHARMRNEIQPGSFGSYILVTLVTCPSIEPFHKRIERTEDSINFFFVPESHSEILDIHLISIITMRTMTK